MLLVKKGNLQEQTVCTQPLVRELSGLRLRNSRFASQLFEAWGWLRVLLSSVSTMKSPQELVLQKTRSAAQLQQFGVLEGSRSVKVTVGFSSRTAWELS